MQVSRPTLAGQPADVAIPFGVGRTRLVVICHGAGLGFEYLTTDVINATYAPMAPLLRMLYFLGLSRDYSVVSPALHDTSLVNDGDTFGNNASTTQLNNVITAAKALYGVGAGKVALLGVSMGNVTIFNYFRRFGGSGIAGMLGIVPVTDLEWQYAIPAEKTAIDAALGTTTYAGASTYDPKVIAPTLTVPWRGWTNSNDTDAPASQSVTLAGLIPNGLGAYEDRGEGSPALNGHDFSGCDGRDLLNWLNSLTW